MKKKVLLAGLAWMLFCSFSIADAKQTIIKLGRSPFCKTLTSVEDLKKTVKAEQKELAEGFKIAGYGDLFEDFMAQFPKAEIKTIQVKKGDTLQWMMYRRYGKGRVRVVKDVVWGGKKPFDAFEFYIEKGGNRYRMVVPFICANMSLGDVTPIPKAQVVPPPAPPVNKPPVCRAKVTPEKAFCGQPVMIDASGSSDADGKITSMVVTMNDANGQVLEKKVVNTAPFATEMVMPCGTSTVKVVVIDDKGSEASSTECQAAVLGMKRGRFLADVGFFRQFDPVNYLLGRVGYEYRFTQNFSVIGMVGGALELDDSNEGDDAFLVDAFLNYRYDRLFAGVGVGGWFNDIDDQLDAIVNAGVRLFGDPESFNTSLFFEARSDVDEIDNIRNYGRFGAGLRFQF